MNRILQLGFALALFSCTHMFLDPRRIQHADINPDETGKTLVSPIPYNEKSIAAGKKLFKKHCVSCHGVNGIGDGPEAAEITPPPANLTKLSHIEDTYLFKKIASGNDEMPTWDLEVDKKQIWLLVQYVKSLNEGKSGKMREKSKKR